MDLKNYLFICSDYFSALDANGVCVRNIVNSLSDKANAIFVISESDKDGVIYEEKNIVVYGCSKPWFMKLNNEFQDASGLKKIILQTIRGVRGIITSFTYPNVSIKRSKNVYQLAKKIIKKNRIDVVVGCYRPYESIRATVRLKKYFNEDITTCTYHLDLLLSPNTNSKLIHFYKYKRGVYALKREIKTVDYMLVPESAKDVYPKDEKIEYIDFPLYIQDRKIISNGFQFEKNVKNIVYIGSIDGKNRELDYILRVLDVINKESFKVKLHIWGKITDTHTIELVKRCEYAVYYGLIDNMYTSYLLKEADFCLNLSNKVTYDMIPSKIFQLFSIKNRIINVVEDRRDKSLVYFEKNNFTINLFVDSPIEDNVKILLKEIEEKWNYNPENNDNLYEKSCPEYTVRLLENMK